MTIKPDPEKECSSCGAANVELHKVAPSPFTKRKDDYHFCDFCYETFAGNACQYPGQVSEWGCDDPHLFCGEHLTEKATGGVMTMIEKLAGCDRARATTAVAKKSVHYTVDMLENDEWVTVWEKTVRFGRDENHRAGGYAFRDAASEQERNLLDAKAVA